MVDLVEQESGQERELSRIQLIQVLAAKVPLNVYGIPEGVYRPDLLPDSFTLVVAQDPQPTTSTAVEGENDAHLASGESNGYDEIADTGPAQYSVIGVGDVEPGQSVTDELQPETGSPGEVVALEGNHPVALELSEIIDPQQSILERLPDTEPLVEAKAELGGTDVIAAFAGSFASRGKSPSDTTLLPSGGDEGTDEPPVDLPEDCEATRTPAPNGAPEVVDPTTAEDQHLQRVGVDLMQFRHAFVPIVFAEGFPAFPDGRPIWLRTDYEPEDVHRLFEQYLMMGQAGVRQLYLLEDLGPYKLHQLQEFFHLYSWSVRMKAHDIFRVAEFQAIQANRAIEMEDDHYIKSQRLFDKAMMYMETEEFLGGLTPKTAIDLLKTVVQIQRMSVGLPPNAAKSEKDRSEHSELEAVMRTFTGRGNGSVPVGAREDGSAMHGDILADPEATHLAQELIIRMTTHKDKV